MRKSSLALLLLTTLLLVPCALAAIFAQTSAPDAALLREFRWRSIGPANMSGRIVDIEAVENDFRHVLLASASGGVWKSVNAGTTWQPVFDQTGVASIGDLAIFQKDPNLIWVGTGEANNRNSVAWGDGIYKSTDGGQTWTNMGLKETHQIARVITHPVNREIVYVAAIGHLWGYAGERGLFKTTDGGQTWVKLAGGLPHDGKTGCTELVMDPGNPEVLYTAFYHRLRRPYHFESGGPNGGIFKSTDGGKTWVKLTQGLPAGATGRIGLAVYRSNPRIVMAIIEHGVQPRQGDADYNNLSVLGSGIYRSEDGGQTWKYLNRYNNRPFYYSQIRINPLDDQRVYVLTTRFMESTDGGKTFRQGGPGIEGDFHALWLDPAHKDRYYIGNDKGPSLTHDHGRSYNFFDNLSLAQFCAIGVDLRDPYYIYGGTQDNGSWGGPSFARDVQGILTDHWWKLHWGDGSHAQVDPTDWRILYTESENGAARRYNVETHQSVSIRPAPPNIINFSEVFPQAPQAAAGGGRGGRGAGLFRYNWNSPLVLSRHNPKTIYLGGNYLFKSIDGGTRWQIISPDLTTNDPEKTREESGGLTRDVTGAETHCTITGVSESPLTPNLIWVVTDDGNVQLTRNGGAHWENVRRHIPGVPEGIWASSVEASHFDRATAYVTFDGHRSDDFTTWVFKTTDYGQTWTNIANNLPAGHTVWVIREDAKNRQLLFVGTEFSCYVSLNGGRSWTKLMNDLPPVAVRDLVIHPRDNDLVAATHGRGIFILDDITPLQQLTAEVLASEVHLFRNRVATQWLDLSRGGQRGHQFFAGQNPPSIVAPPNPIRQQLSNSALIAYYLKSPQSEIEVEISDLEGQRTRRLKTSGQAGINRLRWDMRFDPAASERAQAQRPQGERRPAGEEGEAAPSFGQGGQAGRLAEPGEYLVKLTVGGKTYTGRIAIRRDPLLRADDRN
jgi:photosystem II stability/assembly factor-like uncharacterized protein